MIYIVSYLRYGQNFEHRYPTAQAASVKHAELARRGVFTRVAERKVLTFTKNWSKL
jgi:hypothetical protein